MQYEFSPKFCGGHHCKVLLSEFSDQKTFPCGIWSSESTCCKVCPSRSMEKPANKDRQSEFPNKPITENRPDDSSSKNTE